MEQNYFNVSGSYLTQRAAVVKAIKEGFTKEDVLRGEYAGIRFQGPTSKMIELNFNDFTDAQKKLAADDLNAAV